MILPWATRNVSFEEFLNQVDVLHAGGVIVCNRKDSADTIAHKLGPLFDFELQVTGEYGAWKVSKKVKV